MELSIISQTSTPREKSGIISFYRISLWEWNYLSLIPWGCGTGSVFIGTGFHSLEIRPNPNWWLTIISVCNAFYYFKGIFPLLYESQNSLLASKSGDSTLLHLESITPINLKPSWLYRGICLDMTCYSGHCFIKKKSTYNQRYVLCAINET